VASPQGLASLQENAGWCTRNRKWTMTIMTPWVSRSNVAGLSSRTSAPGCGELAVRSFNVKYIDAKVSNLNQGANASLS
jgi:hypothetical protein